jgi:hypothetical protein
MEFKDEAEPVETASVKADLESVAEAEPTEAVPIKGSMGSAPEAEPVEAASAPGEVEPGYASEPTEAASAKGNMASVPEAEPTEAVSSAGKTESVPDVEPNEAAAGFRGGTERLPLREKAEVTISGRPDPLPESEGMQPYKTCRLNSVGLGPDQFYSNESTSLITQQIIQVINEEGPISRNLLVKRVLQAWGIARMGSKLDQRFTQLLAGANVRRTEADGTVYFWPQGIEPAAYGIFRVPTNEGERRSAEDLPPEEVAAAVKAVLSAQISLPQDDLVKQVVKILGYARSGAALDKAVRSGIAAAVNLGYALLDGQRVVAK